MRFFALTLCMGLFLNACAHSPKETSSSDQTVPVEKGIPIPPPAPAPGTARVAAQVVDYEDAGEAFYGAIIIKQVYAYGAATPSLPPESKIKVLFRKALFGQAAKGASELLKAGKMLELVLSVQRLPESIASERPAWNVVKIE